MPAPTITDGLEVFVQLVIAAITTWPWSSSSLAVAASRGGACRCARSAVARAARGQLRLGSTAERRRPWPRLVGGRIGCRVGLGNSLVLRVGLVAVARQVVAQRLLEDDLCLAQRDAILRALGPARLGSTLARSSSSSSEKVGFSERSSCHRPCSLA